MSLVKLSELLTLERIILLDSCDKHGALQQLAELVARSVDTLETEELMEVLLAREAIMSTGIGLGIAVPHARLKNLDHPVLAVGVCKKGIAYESLDDQPVHIIVLIVVPYEAQKQYLRILARVTLLLKGRQLREKLLAAASPKEIHQLLSEY